MLPTKYRPFCLSLVNPTMQVSYLWAQDEMADDWMLQEFFENVSGYNFLFSGDKLEAEEATVQSLHQWCIVDLGQINAFLTSIICPQCQKIDSLYLVSSMGDNLCSVVAVILYCLWTADPRNSSPCSDKTSSFTINNITVLLFTRMGFGHTSMKSFASLLGQ